MKTFTKTYEIKAPVKKVWQALVDPKIIDEWGGGPAVMAEEVGFEWTLWNGALFGRNTEVTSNKKLVQDWSGEGWEKPSTCIFELEEKGDQTELKLSHSNIPDSEYADVKRGWDEDYIGPLKELVEKA